MKDLNNNNHEKPGSLGDYIRVMQQYSDKNHVAEENLRRVLDSLEPAQAVPAPQIQPQTPQSASWYQPKTYSQPGQPDAAQLSMKEDAQRQLDTFFASQAPQSGTMESVK